jgi:hypothetical protein
MEFSVAKIAINIIKYRRISDLIGRLYAPILIMLFIFQIGNYRIVTYLAVAVILHIFIHLYVNMIKSYKIVGKIVFQKECVIFENKKIDIIDISKIQFEYSGHRNELDSNGVLFMIHLHKEGVNKLEIQTDNENIKIYLILENNTQKRMIMRYLEMLDCDTEIINVN